VNIRTPCLAAILTALALVPGAARQQGSPAGAAPVDQPQLPTFRTGANLVRVDVTVLDHRGNPVPSLTAEDFLIEEDGVPQKVTSMKFVEATGQPGDDVSLPIRSREHAALEAARDDVRVFLIFWDEYSIEQLGSAARAREALTRLVTKAFQPTDLVALMDQLTPTDAIRFTRDFQDLGLDIGKLRGRLGLFFPTRSAVEDAQLSTGGDVRRLRAEVTLSALKSAVVHLGAIREGRKALIFVSEGVRGLGRDSAGVMADVVRAANESNTAIYSVDPRGLTTRGASDSLFVLAESTGGRTIVNTNGLDSALRQIVRESSAFYLLGYSSVRNPADGRFHQIKVRVDRPGLDVRARHGYWAPSARVVDAAKRAAAAARPPDAVAVALAALGPTTARHVLDVWTGVSRAADGRPALRVAWARRSGAGGGADRPHSVAVTATDAVQVFSFRGTIDGPGPTFDVRPGPVKVVLTIRDPDDGVVDTETRTLIVPDVDQIALAMTSPVLLRARTPLELRALMADPDAPPFAGNLFTRTERLLVRVSLLSAAGGEVTVSSRLVGRTGRQLVALPIAPLPDRPGTYQIDLPLSSVAPGEYVIAVEASRGTDRAEALVAIRVG
jgi:VWFA-related protein